MQHYFYSITRIHVNTTKLCNITCTSATTCVILRSLECIPYPFLRWINEMYTFSCDNSFPPNSRSGPEKRGKWELCFLWTGSFFFFLFSLSFGHDGDPSRVLFMYTDGTSWVVRLTKRDTLATGNLCPRPPSPPPFLV